MDKASIFQWIVGIVIALLAAGGGVVAWLELFHKRKRKVTWRSLQSEYFESFDVPYTSPARQNQWPSFQEEIWSAEIKHGAYCYTNRTDEHAVHYHYVGINEMDISERPVSIDIKTENLPNSTSISGSGLLYRFNPQNAYYYAFTLSASGIFYFYKRNQDGYNALYSSKSDSFSAESFNKLGIIGKGGRFSLYINDSLVKVIKDDEFKSGDTGIIAVGIGVHHFDNFAIHKRTKHVPK